MVKLTLFFQGEPTMSEQINKPRMTISLDRLVQGVSIKTMIILATLANIRGGIGLTEEELVNKSGLDKDDALSEISWLEMDGFVCSFICQEGTAGPFARRYKLDRRVEVKLEINKPK